MGGRVSFPAARRPTSWHELPITWRGARQGVLARDRKETSISKLSVVRLNDEENLGEPLRPWPPPGGLPPGEDPFARVVEEEVQEPHFLVEEPKRPARESWVTPERAVAASIVVHLLLATIALFLPWERWERDLPESERPDPLGLVKLLSAPPPQPRIPIEFFPAPGQAVKEVPKKPVLPSDANRVAHGGDPKLPKAETPNSQATRGIQDTAEGARRPRKDPNQWAKEMREVVATTPLEDLRKAGLLQDQSPPRLQGIPRGALTDLTADRVSQARKSAAASDGGGEDGAGYEREGGFVDSGPLSFDTAGYDWGAYAAEMIRKIKRNWDVPGLAHYGIKGKLTVRFFILKDGRVEGARILAASGTPPYDNAAFQAIVRSSPFRPLPDDLGHDREGVTITFFYNIRPEEMGGR